ncbi:hypothetical protein CMV_009593 [Castanea mollissima]|uniref:Uncharacterized protein n=1 Tax=Castanea mollissima TaxID=60419 RepID=A0A8J4W1D0_9ROSI|nr:hypothetical protein CMV_009593 [Castanea mollissima]
MSDMRGFKQHPKIAEGKEFLCRFTLICQQVQHKISIYLRCLQHYAAPSFWVQTPGGTTRMVIKNHFSVLVREVLLIEQCRCNRHVTCGWNDLCNDISCWSF